MLELVAIAEEDGWAFVRTEDGLFTIRPPYQAWNKTKTSESIMEQGIFHHGFAHAKMDFQDFPALIKHLKQVQADAWNNQESGAFTGREIEDLVHELPAEKLAEFLDRVEEELIPTAQWEAAKKLLTTFVGVKTVRMDDDLNNRVRSLLKQCQEQTKSVQNTFSLEDSCERFKQRFHRLSAVVNVPEFMKYANNRASYGNLFIHQH